MTRYVKAVRFIEDVGYRILLFWQLQLIKVTCYRVSLQVANEQKEKKGKLRLVKKETE